MRARGDIGKRVRGRKRDGRRSSLPPPPATDRTDLDAITGGDSETMAPPPGEPGDVDSLAARADDGRASPSASVLLSAAMPSPSSSRARVPAQPPPSAPASGAETPVLGTRVADLVEPAEPGEPMSRPSSQSLKGSTETAAIPGGSEPTLRITDHPAPHEAHASHEPREPGDTLDDIPSLVPELAAGTGVEPTHPDVTPLAMELDAGGTATATPAPEDTDPVRLPSIPDPTEVSFFDPEAVSAHISRHAEAAEADDMHALSEAELLYQRRSMPHVQARRARLATYVKVTVGTAAALVILAGLLRLSARPSRQAITPTPEAVVAVASEPATPTKAKPAEPPASSSPETAAPEPSASVAPSNAIDATDSTGAPVDNAAFLALAAASQFALEKGKIKDAIDAGEQATALDPTDAKAWLVLGGAYQDRGDMINARRCYRACTEHASRGPVAECRALSGLAGR